MQSWKNRNRPGKNSVAAITRERWWQDRVVILAPLLIIATLSGFARGAPSPVQRQSIHDPALTAPPDANARMQMHDEQTKEKDFSAANAERKKQIADDTAKLLKLATDLKAEIDKTNKDTLSLNVIRKADAIEKLAHDVKEKMKLTVGPG